MPGWDEERAADGAVRLRISQTRSTHAHIHADIYRRARTHARHRHKHRRHVTSLLCSNCTRVLSRVTMPAVLQRIAPDCKVMIGHAPRAAHPDRRAPRNARNVAARYTQAHAHDDLPRQVSAATATWALLMNASLLFGLLQ